MSKREALLPLLGCVPTLRSHLLIFLPLTLLLGLLVRVSGASAAEMAPATKSMDSNFPLVGNFCGTESGVIAYRIGVMGANNACPTYSTSGVNNWTSPGSADERTQYTQKCAGGLPNPNKVWSWAWTHEEQGTYSYKNDVYVELPEPHCVTGTSEGNDNVLRHFHFLCDMGYELTPVVPGSNTPACKRVMPDPLPAKSLGACKSCGSGAGVPVEGNPITLSTGNKYHSETDYVGTGPFPLRFSRHYNSQGQVSGSLGALWLHTYERRLLVTILAGQGAFTSVTAVREDGRHIYFDKTSGSWKADADNVEKLSAGGPGWLLRDGADNVESYDYTGRLVSIANRSGVTQVVNYDVNGRISSVSDQFGHTLTFQYDGVGFLTSVTDPASGLISYSRDPLGNLSSVTYQDGVIRSYVYGEPLNTGGASLPFALTGIVDEMGVRFATYQYDSQNRATSSAHAGGADAISVAYPSATSRIVTDAAGGVRTYNIAPLLFVDRVTAVSGTLCATCSEPMLSYSYDVRGNISSTTDFAGVITTYAYDTRNLETNRTEASGSTVARSTQTQWHTIFRVPTTITEGNRRTEYTHDAVGNVLTKTLRDVSANKTRTWTYTYDAAGVMLTEDLPGLGTSNTTSYTYNLCSTGSGCGSLQTITRPLLPAITFTSYNAQGLPTSITDENGVQTSLTYDARHRLTSRLVAGELTSYEYWSTGQLKKITQPNGSWIQYQYDDAHRLVSVLDSAGGQIDYALDASGNRVGETVKDSGGAVRRLHSRAYNAANQLTQDSGAAGTSAVTTLYSYDAVGNLSGIAAPLSRTSSNTFDELRRLKAIIDPASGQTAFTYDQYDNLVKVVDPRAVQTSYIYNALGDMTSQSSPETGSNNFTYNSTGQLSKDSNANSGKTADYLYDAQGRITSVQYSNGGVTDQTITYSYDAGVNGVGRLTGVADAQHAMTWAYDSLGRVVGKTQQTGAVTLSLAYGFVAGNLASVSMPSGANVTYARDSLGRVSAISVNGTNVLTAATYDPFGPVSGWTWGNGAPTTRSYDADGRVAQVSSAGVTKGYAYDDASRITSVVDSTSAAFSWSYGYDTLDRLTTANSSTITQGFTYDAAGNRKTQTGTTPWTLTYSSYQNRLKTTSGTQAATYTYDASGNVTGYSNITFTYNNRNRLKSFLKSGITTTYIYNALGQRIRRDDGGSSGVVHYLYDEAGHLLGEYGISGALMQETVWMDDLPVATLRPNGSGGITIFYVHTDHLGTPRQVTDSVSGALRWRWESDAFGVGAAENNPSGLGAFEFNLRFPGQVYEAKIGLHQNYFRDYSPAIGRYVESDPIGLRAGVNTYAYVSANPIMSVDPSGLAGTVPRVGLPGIVIPEVAIPGTPANDAWVHAASGAIDSGLTSLANAIAGVKRPEGLSALENRAFDRYCRNHDPCPPLKAATMQAIRMALLKMNNLLADAGKMWGMDKWFNHQDDLRGRLANINAMIGLGQKLGCDMTAEILASTPLYIPSAPR